MDGRGGGLSRRASLSGSDQRTGGGGGRPRTQTSGSGQVWFHTSVGISRLAGQGGRCIVPEQGATGNELNECIHRPAE
jgi:hypothetical protein